MINKNTFHNDALQLFNEKLYSDILNLDNVISKKTTIKYEEEKYYGYFVEKGDNLYFLQDTPGDDTNILDLMPVKVKIKVETDFNKKVFFFIKKCVSVKIPCEKKLSLRGVVDTVANFKHTNPLHFKLYKIITIAGYCSRVNYRVIAIRGFGKDCIINNVQDLVGGICNIYGASFAKLEYSLKYPYLIFNEMGNLKDEDKHNMQQFLLATGAYFNKYIKKTRATETTKEEYNISKTSLGIIYNPPMYYAEKGQEFFDTMFTEAVEDRFIPFYMDGLLNEVFDAQFDTDAVVTENMGLYKDIISTLMYFKEHQPINKYTIPDEVVFTEKRRRFQRSFTKIADFISEYAESEEEYYTMVYELYKTYTDYEPIVKEAKQFIGQTKWLIKLQNIFVENVDFVQIKSLMTTIALLAIQAE